MAEEQPSLHIDSDWKKQAQEEKRRLAEEEAKKRAAAPTQATAAMSAPAGAAVGAPGATATTSGHTPAGRGRRELPPVAFGSIVQTIMTQVLFYLGELATGGAEPTVNLDMAKYQMDMLGVLEEKTKGNLTPAEQHLLDAALYEVRMRYVSVASQYI